VVGADAQCGGFLCCRASNGFPSDPSRQAGPWGAYQCDIPQAGLESMLTYVRDVIKPDLFVWTGDNSPHNVWANNNTEVIDATRNITLIIQKFFNQTNITVYPIQGNHDTWPVNVQDFTQVGSNVPINGFSDTWLEWLGPEVLANFTQYGYYSKVLTLKDGREFNNTRVIGINTQACNNMNWWLIKDRYDPGFEIEWLQTQLAELEAINGTAIMMMHIPTGDDCIHGWGHRFRGLMDRYQHIVRFSLFGHTHNEQVTVVKSMVSANGNGTDV
jgi:sphingomyelin phosphodiesterase